MKINQVAYLSRRMLLRFKTNYAYETDNNGKSRCNKTIMEFENVTYMGYMTFL